MTKYVTLDSVVSEGLSIIGLSGDDELAKNFARMWAWRAVIDMPITDDTIKVAKVYPKNLILKKPQDMRRALEVALYDASDCLIPHCFSSGKTRIYPNVEQYSYTVTTDAGTADQETTTYYLPVDLSEDAYAYYLGTNALNTVAYAQIRYFGYPLDKDGFPMIREEAVQACMYYIRLNWSLRKNENQSEIANNRLMYQQESDRCRARLKSLDMSEENRKEIAALMNRMLPNFNRSRV
jgi:hypothetical protein